MSDFAPIFNKSSKLKSKFLERVGFCINFPTTQQNIYLKFYNASDVLKENCLLEIKNQWKIRFKKSVSLDRLTKDTIKTTRMAFPWFLWKQKSDKEIEKKKHFLEQLYEKLQILNHFLIQRVRFWNNRFELGISWAKFQQLIKFRIKIFKACQISNQPSQHPSEVEAKIAQCIRFWRENFCRQSIFLKKMLSESQFHCVILHCESNKVGIFVVSRKFWFWYFFVKNNIVQLKVFGAASRFQPNFWKHVGFWTKMFKHVILWANILKFAKTLIESLRTCQKIKFNGEIFVQKINFRVVLKRWNVKSSVFALSWKAWFWDGNYGKTHISNPNF